MKEYIISEKEEGITLLKYSFKILPGAGQGMIRKFLRKKNIELNSKKSDGSDILKKGDRICFFLSDETFDKFHGSEDAGLLKAPPLSKERIIYEDKDFLLYDKPPGLLSQPDISKEISLNDMLLSYIRPEGSFKASVCNRLDKNTSGIVLCGISGEGLRILDEAVRKRRIQKHYLCICQGRFEKEGPVTAYLIKDRASNRVSVYDKEKDGSDRIETVFHPVRAGDDFSLVEAGLITGKPHQIRATLSHLGHPIAGDIKYGAKKNIAKRQLLHAYKVIFPSDILEGQTFTAPLPADMKDFVI